MQFGSVLVLSLRAGCWCGLLVCARRAPTPAGTGRAHPNRENWPFANKGFSKTAKWAQKPKLGQLAVLQTPTPKKPYFCNFGGAWEALK